MFVTECTLQIISLYCLVNQLSPLKSSYWLEDCYYECKNSNRIERFQLRHVLATFDQLYVKNIVHERQQKSELHDDDIERVYRGRRQPFCL